MYIKKGDFLPAVLGGKGVNGHEADKGSIVHSVEVIDANYYELSNVARCGKRHGPRSIGYLPRPMLTVNCPKCIKMTRKT